MAAAPMVLSITDAFDDYGSMEALLRRLGLSARCITRFMDEEGFETARDLALARETDVKSTIDNVNKLFGSANGPNRIYFPPIKVARIKALCVYFRRCLMINQIPDIRLIGLARCQEFVDCYNSWTEKQDDTDDVVKQKDLQFDPMKFKTFTDEFKTLLSSLRGSKGITLEYVIRDNNTQTGPPIEVASPDVNSTDILSNNATLSGVDFDRDNAKVFTCLRVILTSTTGWNVISKFSNRRDGRGAFLALQAHFQGRSYFELMKTQATTMMSKTYYHGDRAKFTWETFVSIHMEAHELFVQTGEPLSESMKILNLKNGIRDTAMMENTIEAARTSPAANASFEAYVNFLTEGIASKRSRKETFKHNVPRQVSDISTNGGRGGSRGGRGGRGRGRGRGRGWGQGNGPSIQCEGKTLHIKRSYSREEYNQLSANQKNAIRLARLKLKSQSDDNKSTISELTTALKDSVSVLQKVVVNGVRNATEDNDSNSSLSPTQQLKRRKTNNE